MWLIRIDPEKRSIKRLDVESVRAGLDATFSGKTTASYVLAPNDLLWVLDDGFLTPGNAVWRWAGYKHPLAGVALITGYTYEGQDIAAHIAFQTVQNLVQWSDEESAGYLEAAPPPYEKDGMTYFSTGNPVIRKRQAKE